MPGKSISPLSELAQQATLNQLLNECARAEGFPLSGALDLDAVGSDFSEHLARFDRWISSGHEAEMSYLSRGRERRANPRLVFPPAQSIFCVALPYEPTPAGKLDSQKGPRYARYLRRNDYHEEITLKLERVMTDVSRKFGSPLSWKVCVDTSAVLERSWAALAGLGWIGKNTLLIHPQLGSYLFLGEVLVSHKTNQKPRPLKNYCGNCTRCLEGCPTNAFIEPGVLKSDQCIAYWSLEKRGELKISEDQKMKVGSWIAGCDICQEVCPFNTKPAKSAQSETGDSFLLDTWDALLDESTEDYKIRVNDSALSRVKPAQFSRNLAMTLANSIHSTPEDTWTKALGEKIRARHEKEADPAAKIEWERCLAQLAKRKP